MGWNIIFGVKQIFIPNCEVLGKKLQFYAAQCHIFPMWIMTCALQDYWSKWRWAPWLLHHKIRTWFLRKLMISKFITLIHHYSAVRQVSSYTHFRREAKTRRHITNKTEGHNLRCSPSKWDTPSHQRSYHLKGNQWWIHMTSPCRQWEISITSVLLPCSEDRLEEKVCLSRIPWNVR